MGVNSKKFPLPTQTNEQTVAEQMRKRNKTIKHDMLEINNALAKSDDSELEDLHRKIDCKYQAEIIDWGKSMHGYSDKHGFMYEKLETADIRNNLMQMSAKLEGLLIRVNDKNNSKSSTKKSDINVIVNNTVNNAVDISILFEQVRQKIEDMPGLNDEDTEEIKSKIDELENISKESISKKKKWEKVKPILLFAIDKSADVAISIMPLILQMKLGM